MNSKWSKSPETLNSGQCRQFFVPCDLEIWWMTAKNNRAHLLCCFKLCASLHSHCWIQTVTVTVRKLNSGQNWQFFVPCNLEIWWMTLRNNKAPLLSNINLCASFRCHMWIQTGVTVRKRLNGVMTSVTLTLCMDITSVNGDISWKFQDDTMTGTLSKTCGGRTERSVLRAAWRS